MKVAGEGARPAETSGALSTQIEALRRRIDVLRQQAADGSDSLAKGLEELRAALEQLAPVPPAPAASDVTSPLERERRHMELLASTAERLLATSDPLGTVNELARRVMEFLDCQVFFNFLADEKSGRLHLNACAGVSEATVRSLEWLDYGVAVCGCVAREGCRIVAEHIPTTPDPRTDLVRSFGVKAYACHPILAGEQVLGTLSFGTTNREEFTADELSLMKAVTDQVAIAAVRMRDEAALRASEERYRELFETMQEGLFVGELLLDEAGRAVDFRFIEANPAWEQLTDLPRARVVGRLLSEVLPGLDPYWLEHYAQVVRTGEPAHLDRYVPELGRHYEAFAYSPQRGRFASIFTDISDRKQHEAERERLHAEVNHRMKNNLLLVSSLLDLQLSRLPPESSAAPELREAMTRIAALSVVHEAIYRSQLGKVDLREMLRRIAEVDAEALGRGRVDVSVTGQAVYAASKLASTLALLANELITNAVEHGLPAAGDRLRLEVSISRQAGQVQLSVRNSGRPLPLGFDPVRHAGAGFQTVLGVVQGQLEGSFIISSDSRGTVAEIRFDEKHLTPDEPDLEVPDRA